MSGNFSNVFPIFDAFFCVTRRESSFEQNVECVDDEWRQTQTSSWDKKNKNSSKLNKQFVNKTSDYWIRVICCCF